MRIFFLYFARPHHKFSNGPSLSETYTFVPIIHFWAFPKYVFINGTYFSEIWFIKLCFYIILKMVKHLSTKFHWATYLFFKRLRFIEIPCWHLININFLFDIVVQNFNSAIYWPYTFIVQLKKTHNACGKTWTCTYSVVTIEEGDLIVVE